MLSEATTMTFATERYRKSEAWGLFNWVLLFNPSDDAKDIT